MPVFLQSVAAWLATMRVGLYVITAAMAMAWAASEVIVGYPDQPMRALKTRGAWLLMAVNAFFACVALAASLALIPDAASVWLALGVGLSWQAMLRGGINIQPLPISSAADAAEGMGVPLNELYARLQGFCVGQIQRYLVSERVALMERVLTQLDVADLARIARLVTVALGDATPEAEQYIQRIETDEKHGLEQREIMLISLILNNRGSNILRKRVKERHKGQ